MREAGVAAVAALALTLTGTASAWAQQSPGVVPPLSGAAQTDMNFFGVVWDSISGDV